MLVRDIMSSEIIAVRPSHTVQAFISAMEMHHIHEMPVIDAKGKLLGDVQYKKLATKGIIDPSRARIRAIMDAPPPVLSPEDTVETAADLLFRTGLRAVPVVENDVVAGMISVYDILHVAAATKPFKKIRAEAIMSIAEVIDQHDDIGKARVLMRERNISRLPVTDHAGRLVGIVTVFELLRALKPREKQSWYSMAAEVDRIMGCPVSTIMNNSPITASRKANLNKIARLMVKYRTSGIIIVDEGQPIGVLTVKDLLEVYISSLQQLGVYYQIIGLTNEDELVMNTLDRMIRDTLRKIAAVVPVQFFFVHFKKHKLPGLRIKYSVRARLRTDAGFFIAKAWKWDPRDALGLTLDHLERRLLRERDATRTLSRQRSRQFKQLRAARRG
jgi:CBS domain-containing protein